jgi:RNA polymerase sigma factor for flagellar operon FliA
VDLLPEREKLVMSLYYEQDLNLREIGEVLGVSESRVCQIHGQALIRLRARLNG